MSATHKPEVVELLSRMVSIPSLSHHERELADFVQELIRSAGIRTERHEDNVFGWIGDGPDCLLLNSHLDVVPPSIGHPFDPFDPVIDDGRLYGRGSVDAKASGAAMLAVLLQLHAAGWTPPNGRLVVALTACEETGGDYNGLEAVRPQLPPVTSAIVGEPTDLQPCLAQKGLLILRLTARGRSAHAARPHLGANAILVAMEDIERLGMLRFEEEPYLGSPTLTVTTIQGGSARNVVPETCEFYLDIRTTPRYAHEDVIQLIRETVQSKVEVHSRRFVPVSTPESTRIARACLRALPDAAPFGSPTASDWIFLHDVPTVKLGPGSSELSHTPRESIATAEVRRAVDVYREVVLTYFGTAPASIQN